MTKYKLPVAIIGGGPVGLAAAAHLAKKNEPFILLEAGKQIASNISDWGHVRMFSPWQYNIDQAAEELLVKHSWVSPPKDDLPTGEDLVTKYLVPLSDLPEIKPYIRLNSKVVAIGRKGLDKLKTYGRENLPFVIQYEADVERQLIEVRAVIDATGTWNTPNPIGSGGILAIGEQEARSHIYYGIPDVLNKYKVRYAGKNVLVVGGGHSAINSLLELNKLKNEYPETNIKWALRKKSTSEAYGGGENDQLPARGELGIKMKQLVDSGRVEVYTPFYIHEIMKSKNTLNIIGMLNSHQTVVDGIDEIITNTGARPDLSFLREVRVSIDPALESVPALAELIDPNIHSCGTVRPHGEAELRQLEKDFYIVGAKSYGRAPTFLLATGYEQVRSVVSALVGDWESAQRVELELPETGVCGSRVKGCCGSEKKVTTCC